MALRRGRRERQQDVSNETHVTGGGNKVVTGAAGRDLTQPVTLADLPGGATGLEAALEQLAKLRTALADHPGDVADIEQCNTAVDLIDEELNSGRPRRSLLDLALGGLVPAIGAATDVLAIAQSLREAVSALFA
ncbi:hypothetical protein OHB05_36475 [Streptomyces sp. NBC_00638]|uniref:hypothetical protein n=1 Tax=unclassified Streptomyces TaxID=2593676 RepID=UPI002259A6F7|nr:hypothetical protein [Streptomyces sp. NBC_00638]MCX5008069.1 hypothetical protein [Streptomyces sp. NBC_00638]